MNNKKATKRALLTSVMALVMCVVMLVGTTFAWFTDTASTGVNKIQAGNLKMEVTYKNTVDGAFTEVSKETPVFNNDARWEPGHVEFAVLNVKNIGNLALKYKLGINIASETGSTNVYGDEFKLSKYIKFAVINGESENLADRDALVAEAGAGTALNAGYADEDHLVPVGKETSEDVSSKTVTLVVWMPKSVGNEANYKVAEGITAPSIDLGINVVATQYTYERDSFDEKYDKDATYPVIVSNQQQANDAITNAADKKVNISIASGQTITLDNGIANSSGSDNKARDITFVGDGSQTVNVATEVVGENNNKLNYQRGSSFTFENLTIQAGEDTYEGIVCNELTFKDCTIKGVTTLYGKATFINCVFENTMANQYSIWTWGGTDVTFEGCTFNTNGKAILLFGEEKTTNLTVNNCVFNDRNNGAAGKAAIEIGEANYGKHNNFTVVINGSTVESGFADGKNTGSKLWANKNNMSAQYLSVTIDGNKVQ